MFAVFWLELLACRGYFPLQYYVTVTSGLEVQTATQRVTGDGQRTTAQQRTATGTSTNRTTVTTMSTASTCCGCSTGRGTTRDAAPITPVSYVRSTRTTSQKTPKPTGRMTTEVDEEQDEEETEERIKKDTKQSSRSIIINTCLLRSVSSLEK